MLFMKSYGLHSIVLSEIYGMHSINWDVQLTSIAFCWGLLRAIIQHIFNTPQELSRTLHRHFED